MPPYLAVTQGYRILSGCENRLQVSFVPTGLQALAFNACFGRFFLAQQVQGQMAQDREIGVGMTLAHPTGVFIHDHIQDPMDTILDPPVTTGRVQDLLGVPAQAANVVDSGKFRT
jgi:hypothetical protein